MRTSRGAGIWWILCDCGDTTQSCSICMIQLHSGATRYSPGLVSCTIRFFAELTALGNPNDAFWLAQTHFLTGHYLRAESTLTEPLPQPSHSLSRLSSDKAVNGHGKGKGRMEEDITMNGHLSPRSNGDESPKGRGKLIDESLACRYLAAQCLVSLLPRILPQAHTLTPGAARKVP